MFDVSQYVVFNESLVGVCVFVLVNAARQCGTVGAAVCFLVDVTNQISRCIIHTGSRPYVTAAQLTALFLLVVLHIYNTSLYVVKNASFVVLAKP